MTVGVFDPTRFYYTAINQNPSVNFAQGTTTSGSANISVPRFAQFPIGSSLSFSGTPPAPFGAGTTYYVVSNTPATPPGASGNIQVSLSVGGSPVTASASGNATICTASGNTVNVQDGWIYDLGGNQIVNVLQRVPPSLTQYGYQIQPYQGNTNAPLDVTSAAPIPNVPALSVQNYSVIGAPGGGPPFAPDDPSVVFDIGILGNTPEAMRPLNTWQNLPSGWSAVSSGGYPILSNTLGFIPGPASGSSASTPQRLQVTAGTYSSVSTTTFTMYMRIARAALCQDNSNSSTSQWFNSAGNTAVNGAGNLNCAPFEFNNNGASEIVSMQVAATVTYVYKKSDSAQYSAFPILNANYTTAYRDPTYCDLIMTVNGTQMLVYIDGYPVLAKTMSSNITSGAFYAFYLGNTAGGGGSGVGGNLGPYPILRAQLASSYYQPPTLPVLVSLTGDSYGINAAAQNSDGGQPNSATISTINAACTTNVIGPPLFLADQTTLAGSRAMFLLEAYALRNIGAYFPLYTACKSGNSTYFTGGVSSAQYSSPIDNPSQISATNNTGFQVYADAVNAAQPHIAVFWDSVNNQIGCPDTSGNTLDTVNDIKWRFDYWANRNPRLRYILFIEAQSLQNMPSGSTGITPAQCATLTASWRALSRAFFHNGTPYLAGGRVPVIYIPTYEYMDGAPDALKIHWGTDPANTVTSGGQAGPVAGSGADVHLSQYGMFRAADLVWPTLQTCIKAVLRQGPDSGAYYFGLSGAAPILDCVHGSTQVVTLNSATVTFGIPVNVPGPKTSLTVIVVQDSTGSRALAWNATFRNAPSISAGTAGQRATLRYEYDGVNWQYIGGSTVFA